MMNDSFDESYISGDMFHRFCQVVCIPETTHMCIQLTAVLFAAVLFVLLLGAIARLLYRDSCECSGPDIAFRHLTTKTESFAQLS